MLHNVKKEKEIVLVFSSVDRFTFTKFKNTHFH